MSLSTVVAIIGLSIALLALINLLSRPQAKGVDREHFRNEWNDIVIASRDEKTIEMSIINADKLLDEALKCLGYSGNTMAERLISAKHRLRSKNQVWTAHKLRNKIVHEPKYRINKKDVDFAMHSYLKALKELGVF